MIWGPGVDRAGGFAAVGDTAARAWRDLAGHWRRPLAPVAMFWPFWCGLAFLAVTILICVGLVADETVARAAERLDPGLVALFGVVTQAGKSNWLFALSLLAIAFALYRREGAAGARRRAAWGLIASRAFYFLTVMAFSGIASQVIKHIVGRARPYLIDSVGPFHFDPFSFKAVLASFPSGHTTTMFAAFGALALLSPRFGAGFLLLALPVAASRIVVGAHYPSDVCGGLFLGVASALIVARIFARRRIAFTVTPEALLPRPRGGGLIVEELALSKAARHANNERP
ncbi:phosphatase PAP2 family protein [Rhodoblastus acidophilus]|uniref:Phosphatase PAP2 family protein n=1 Tax=Candidatus Rhodoblastus alkanivorans TaxID=2954117 RepID=A0ABS9ZB92_9HYPH|nr:phosphatase PAP2 family protein [Candidatus Rhodoblastus alkanivorans]MCI4678007.1 phosphatase PAP2 family protein [Candidatus Rhodoblastus alkanivorans]MCI4683902.1 phosphatase PAP2 family protein [Candidatus Rhodoblastus alkanivorans]MDI4641219.1 phosphatase PAP2 family protein [Rhodoblastus acidophilus]